MNDELREIKSVAEDIALGAGAILMEHRGKQLNFQSKSDALDIVTEADKASEAFILEQIDKHFPDHAILSEETGENNKTSDYRWIIDPLDGTKEFARNLPFFNVSLALEYKNKTVVATVYKPLEGDLFSAAMSIGSFINKKPIAKQQDKKLKDSIIYVYLPSYKRHPDTFEESWKQIGQINKHVYRLRSCADENGTCCWTAAGRCDAFINVGDPPKYWDIVPGLLIAEEAGCKMSTSDGLKVSKSDLSSIIVANPFIHQDLIDILSGI